MAGVGGPHIGLQVIGGSTASAGQFPWQAQVRMDNSYFCGGSIISSQWILSAGHCASGYAAGRDETFLTNRAKSCNG